MAVVLVDVVVVIVPVVRLVALNQIAGIMNSDSGFSSGEKQFLNLFHFQKIPTFFGTPLAFDITSFFPL